MEIFISYAREDEAAAKRLRDALRGVPNVSPWLDSERLLPGMDWKKEIMQAIETCDLAILLVSRSSVNKKGFVQREIREVLDKAKLYPPGRLWVLPARLDATHPLHRELQDLHWVDLFPDWESGVARIIESIRHVSDKGPRNSFLCAGQKMPATWPTRGFRHRRDFCEELSARRVFKGSDLMHFDLSGLDLSGVDFSGANLVCANLADCSLRNCVLRSANLERAQLAGAKIGGADLSRANMWGAELSGVVGLEIAGFAETNIYRVKGISDEFLEEIRAARGCFESSTYDQLFSHLQDVVDLTKEQIVADFPWIYHGYFRFLFSPESGSIRKALLALRNVSPQLVVEWDHRELCGSWYLDSDLVSGFFREPSNPTPQSSGEGGDGAEIPKNG